MQASDTLDMARVHWILIIEKEASLSGGFDDATHTCIGNVSLRAQLASVESNRHTGAHAYSRFRIELKVFVDYPRRKDIPI